MRNFCWKSIIRKNCYLDTYVSSVLLKNIDKIIHYVVGRTPYTGRPVHTKPRTLDKVCSCPVYRASLPRIPESLTKCLV